MGLSSDLISQFVKATKDTEETSKESKVNGTIVEYNGSKYVRLDGSELLTPISTTVAVDEGERVTVTIKDHTATVDGNTSSPSAKDKDVQDIGSKITEFEVVIADKVSTKELEAVNATIDNLVSENVTIKNKLTANEASIKELEAGKLSADEANIKFATIDSLTAAEAEIENLKTNKLDAEIADITYATIKSLEATDAKIYNLESTYGDFKDLTTEKFTAITADIDELEANKLSATEAELKYANIDFSNIGKAAIEHFYATSGLIKDVVVGDGTITGELVGVTIKGDLIEGGTVVADKLVIKGTDGLYYKLNTDGETVESEQTEYNSLDGKHILAKSITATKVNVKDLVAFGATIGGFNITDESLYSGVKESVSNTTRGIYMDKTGQLAIGDSSNYLKFYKDQNGNYRLEISASSMKFHSSSKTVEEVVNSAIISSVEEFYQSDSHTELIGGEWSTGEPTWIDGKYIWRRTKNTYGDDREEYTPSETGVCITGNTGATGSTGEKGEDSVLLYIDSSNGTVFKNNSMSTILSVVIYYGSKRIIDIDTLREEFGESSYLQWKWKLPEDDDYVSVDPEDYRISGDGFAFSISADDVVSRATIICNLIT